MEILNVLPEYIVALPGEDVPEGAIRWSNPNPPPVIGEEFVIRVNGIGAAVAVGYFVDHDWLGVAARVKQWPKLLAKQNGDARDAYVFGAEIKPAS